jgi:hypothetical protein
MIVGLAAGYISTCLSECLPNHLTAATEEGHMQPKPKHRLRSSFSLKSQPKNAFCFYTHMYIQSFSFLHFNSYPIIINRDI